MILKGSQRGGAVQLARHLMNDLDNDHISVHEMRGFVSDSLAGAFKEVEAISKGTRCKQYLFSLSLNPPELENAAPFLFEAAIDDIEKKLGLSGQPRAIIFHEKNERRHAHCVWSRIDMKAMRSINLPHFKMKLQDIARDLYITHEWEMPAGFKDKQKRDPLNYGSVESEQAKRCKRDPKAIKEVFRKCWEHSDSKVSFAQALAEQGYILAKGDRRGFVAVDITSEVYSIARWIGIKTKEVKARLGLPDGLPNVAEALLRFEETRSDQFDEAFDISKDKHSNDLLAFTAKRLALVKTQRDERNTLSKQHHDQLIALQIQSVAVPSNGLKAIWNRVTGKQDAQRKQQQKDRIALEEQYAMKKLQLIQDQLKERRLLQQSYRQLEHHHELAIRKLWRDLDLSATEYNHHTVSQDVIDHRKRYIADPSQPLVIEASEDKSLAGRVRSNPAYVLEVISQHTEEFSRNDVVRGLSNFIDNPALLYLSIEQALNSNELIETGIGAKKRYTTKSLLDIKQQLQAKALGMADSVHGTVNSKFMDAAIRNQNRNLQLSVGAQLSAEQELAIRHVLGKKQLSLVTGYAGAGKSTMLEAAAQAWQQSGYNVIGAALSGKAADGLENSSGISSRTLASLEKSWEGGYNLLTKNDVLVIDEAGMVDLRQMARIVSEVQKRGTKLVLVGDAEQLQPILAGTPFKELEAMLGSAKLSEIRRQSQNWQRDASMLFAERKTTEALQIYQEQGRIGTSKDTQDAISCLVEDYVEDIKKRGDSVSRLALAHRRKDVHLINQSIRQAYQDAGLLHDVLKVKTDHGPRKFSIGDRIVLTKNDRDLAVRNGMLGSISGIENGHLIIALDTEHKVTRIVTINPKNYSSIDHGYATTIHKSQGVTVDQTFVLGSKTLDRHLTYVAMTRHKSETKLYLDQHTQRKLIPTMEKLPIKLRDQAPMRS